MNTINSNSMIGRVPKLIIVFLIIDIGLCALYIINVAFGHSYLSINMFLDLDNEISLATWYSSMQYFCLFILSSIFYINKRKLASRNSFLLIFLPVIFLLMSIDESTSIHESIGAVGDILLPSGSRDGTFFNRTGIWMILVGLPFFIFFMVLMYSTKTHFGRDNNSFGKLMTGMIILLIGALGIEFLANLVDDDYYFIEVAFEELFEMIGVTIMVWAVYDLVLVNNCLIIEVP